MNDRSRTTSQPAATIPPDDPQRKLTLARPDEDKKLPHISVAGDTYTILVSGADTAGRYCLIDMHVPPGGGPPPHRHDFEEMFTILEGEYKGRVVWARLNLVNPNQTAVKIAQSELSAVCRAVGVMTPRDSCELHNIPLLITVKVKKREDNGELTNEVKGFEPKTAATGKPQQAQTNTPPWRRP